MTKSLGLIPGSKQKQRRTYMVTWRPASTISHPIRRQGFPSWLESGGGVSIEAEDYNQPLWAGGSTHDARLFLASARRGEQPGKAVESVWNSGSATKLKNCAERRGEGRCSIRRIEVTPAQPLIIRFLTPSCTFCIPACAQTPYPFMPLPHHPGVRIAHPCPLTPGCALLTPSLLRSMSGLIVRPSFCSRSPWANNCGERLVGR